MASARSASTLRSEMCDETTCCRSSMSYTKMPSSLFISGSTSRGTAMSMKNMGRLRRLLRNFSPCSLRKMVCGAPVELMTMSAWHGVVQFFERDRLAVELLRQGCGAFESAIANVNLLRAMRQQMPRGQLAHLARTDEVNALALEVAENLLCQVDGDRRDRYGRSGDRGLGPHALGDGEGTRSAGRRAANRSRRPLVPSHTLPLPVPGSAARPRPSNRGSRPRGIRA